MLTSDIHQLKAKLRKISKHVGIISTFTMASKLILESQNYILLSNSSATNPYLSIIIPFFRSKDTVIEALKKTLSIKLPYEYEIIVVDDGSDDDTSEYLRNHFNNKLTLVKLSSNFGPATARNIGVKFSRGEILFFLDSDQYISNSAILSELISEVDEKVVISYLVTKEDGEPITWPMKFPTVLSWILSLFLPRRLYRGVALALPKPDEKAKSDWNGINFIIKRNIFPFFEERYYGEDIDLFKRLSLAGINNIFINKSPVVIFSKGIQSPKRIGKAKYTLFQAKIAYATKYFPNYAKIIFKTTLVSWAFLISLKELLLHTPNNFFKAKFFYRLGAFDLHKVWFW